MLDRSDSDDLHRRIQLRTSRVSPHGPDRLAGSVQYLPNGTRNLNTSVSDLVFLVGNDSDKHATTVRLDQVFDAIGQGLHGLDCNLRPVSSLDSFPGLCQNDALMHFWGLLAGPMHGLTPLVICGEYRAMDPWAKVETWNIVFVDADHGLLQYVVHVNIVTLISRNLDPAEIKDRLAHGDDLCLDSGIPIKDVTPGPVQEMETSEFVVDWEV
ncbi:hypothetical protein HKX48_008719 [Thoreauomyces humboldtii]|nr:hypothetical protein HKX48_008719 [Thoreauomyces humboldtii]